MKNIVIVINQIKQELKKNSKILNIKKTKQNETFLKY